MPSVAAQGTPNLGSGLSVPRVRGRVNADTGVEADGLTRRVMLNILEAFFRRPWLYLLPLILMLGLGLASVAGAQKEFRSVGLISASTNTLLTDLTQANAPGFSFESPASVTSRNLNELLRTREFLLKVADRTGLATTDAGRDLLLEQIAMTTSSAPDGDNLVRISSTTRDPALSQQLAAATIQSFVQWAIDSDVSESTAAEDFFEAQAEAAEAAATGARTAVDDYLIQNPIADGDNRPLAQQLEIDRLTAILDRAETKYGAVLDQRDEARLATAQATTVVEQRLRVVDQPTMPFAPEPRLKQAMITVIFFGLVGTLLSLALIVLAATLDRTIRIPNDISAKFGLEVLAVVPNART